MAIPLTIHTIFQYGAYWVFSIGMWEDALIIQSEVSKALKIQGMVSKPPVFAKPFVKTTINVTFWSVLVATTITSYIIVPVQLPNN